MERRRSRTCPGGVDAPATMMPRGWKSGRKRSSTSASETRARGRRRAAARLAIELDQRVDRDRDRRRARSAGSGRPTPRRGARARAATGRRSTRASASRSTAGSPRNGAEQRARGEAVGQRARRGVVERHRREHDVAQRLGEDAADAEHHARPELRIAHEPRDQLARAAHLLGDEQPDRAVLGSRAREQLRGRGSPPRRRRADRGARGRARSCARSRRRTASARPGSRAPPAAARASARARHEPLRGDRHAVLREQRLRGVLGERRPSDRPARLRPRIGRLLAQSTRLGVYPARRAPPNRRPPMEIAQARQARRLDLARPPPGARGRRVREPARGVGLRRALDPRGGRARSVRVDRLSSPRSTEKLVLATGIANIYARDAMTMRAIRETLGEASQGRFVLGLGVSHAPMVTGLRKHEYGKPIETMRGYLEAIERGDLHRADARRARADRARRAAPEDARALARRGARRPSLLRAARAHRARARDPRQGRLAVPRADGAARDRRLEGARDRAPEHADLHRAAQLPQQPEVARLRGRRLRRTAAATGWSTRSSRGATRR